MRGLFFFVFNSLLVLCVISVYNIHMTCVRYTYALLERGEVMKRRVNITLEEQVLQRIDNYADAHYTSRSGAITMLIVEATEQEKRKRDGMIQF